MHQDRLIPTTDIKNTSRGRDKGIHNTIRGGGINSTSRGKGINNIGKAEYQGKIH